MHDIKEFLITLLPAAVGSALSVFDAKHNIPNKVYALLEFLFGLAVAMYGGHAVSEFFSIPIGSPKSLAISFTIGYIGLTILRDFKARINEIVTKAIAKFVDKYL